MKRMFAVLGLLALGAVLGRFFDGVPPRAEAGGGNPLPSCQDINGDGSSDVADAINFLQWLFQGGPDPTCPAGNGLVGLPDTGQTKCYDATGGETPCGSATCRGQDGSYATGCPPEGRFVDNLDGTVTDNCTGLMWQKDTADVNGDGQSTNQDSLPWCEALSFCESLSFAGHDDWRLPNVRELQSIADYERLLPSIDPVFGAFLAVYWSSTSVAGSPVVAWVVSFGSGGLGGGSKGDGGLYVRAVRSGP